MVHLTRWPRRKTALLNPLCLLFLSILFLLEHDGIITWDYTIVIYPTVPCFGADDFQRSDQFHSMISHGEFDISRPSGAAVSKVSKPAMRIVFPGLRLAILHRVLHPNRTAQ